MKTQEDNDSRADSTISSHHSIWIRCVFPSLPSSAISIEIRPLSRGFSIWAAGDSISDCGNSVRMLRTYKKFGWKNIYATLLKEPRLKGWGDLWAETQIDGLPQMQSDLIRLAFIVDPDHEDRNRQLGDYLAALGDNELMALIPEGALNAASISSVADRVTHSNVLEEMYELVDVAAKYQVSNSSLVFLTLKLFKIGELSREALIRSLTKDYYDIFIQSFKNSFNTSTEGNDPKRSTPTEGMGWRRLIQTPFAGTDESLVELMDCWLKHRSKSHLSQLEWSIVEWFLSDNDAAFDEQTAFQLIVRVSDKFPITTKNFVTEVANYCELPNQLLGSKRSPASLQQARLNFHYLERIKFVERISVYDKNRR
jgi:hypothetical protein